MTKKTIAELTAKAEAEDEMMRLHTAAIKRHGLKLDQTQIAALESLLDHCFGEECNDFEGKLNDIDVLYVRGKDGRYSEIDGAELEKNHVFLTLLTLQNALLGLHRTPADVIRQREMELITKKRSYGGRGMTSTKQLTDHEWVGETFSALTIQALKQLSEGEFEPGEFPNPRIYLFNPGREIMALDLPDEMWHDKPNCYEMIRAAVSKCQSLAMVMYATVNVHQGEATQESYSAMLHKKTGVATVIFPMSRVHKKLVFGKPETWPVVQPEYPVF